MLDDLASHSVPLKGYPMSHVFLSEGGALPSPEHLDQIFPLDAEAARALWDFEAKAKLTSFPPDTGKYFRTSEKLAFGEDQDPVVKKWLYERSLPFSTKCFLCFQQDTAFILTWKMVIHYSPDLFFGHDVVVWDRSLNWALYYDHNDVFHFAKDRIYDGESAQLKMREMIQQINAAGSKQ